jgi:hypothetical protein
MAQPVVLGGETCAALDQHVKNAMQQVAPTVQLVRTTTCTGCCACTASPGGLHTSGAGRGPDRKQASGTRWRTWKGSMCLTF